MEEAITFRGRQIGPQQIEFLRDLIARHPEASRRRLSELVCEEWDWRQANGALCSMVCRSLMLLLHRAGHIELPPPRSQPVNPLAKRRRPVLEEAIDQNPIIAKLKDLRPLLRIEQVRRTKSEKLFNALVEHFHYLGYTQPVGEHLKYMILLEQRPIACMTWCSPPWHMGPRDRFIGWSPQTRRQNLHLLAYNSRYLILPWVEVRYLASHILAQIARRISSDWQSLYDHPVYYLETFVDTDRFAGICYKAANWVLVGQTTGRGIKDKKHKVTLSKKDVLGYPLRADFRHHLCREGLYGE